MLKTEMRNPNTTHIDKMSTGEMMAAIQQENLHAAQAVGSELEALPGRWMPLPRACSGAGGCSM